MIIIIISFYRAEECDCLCTDTGPCCCHGEDKTASESSDNTSTPLKVPSDFEEFDGVDDILAVRLVRL